jgi:hypothetical protein
MEFYMKRLICYPLILLIFILFTGTILGQSTQSKEVKNKQKTEVNKVQVQNQSRSVNIEDKENLKTDDEQLANQKQGQKKGAGNSNNGNKYGKKSGSRKGYGDGSGIRPQDGKGHGKHNGKGNGSGKKNDKAKKGRSLKKEK